MIPCEECSFYPKFCRVLLATVVETFISISYNLLVLVQIFDCKNCLKFACLKVAKKREFFVVLFVCLLVLLWIWHIGCISLDYFLKYFSSYMTTFDLSTVFIQLHLE